jgi:hypothetical protein
MNRLKNTAQIKTEFAVRSAAVPPIYLETLKRDNIFFSENNMRFLASRCLDATYNELTCFFVTSEKAWFGGAKRKYTVSQYNREEKRIETIGDLCGYDTRYQAIKAKQELELTWILSQL